MSLRHVLLGAVALLLPLVTVIHAASPPQQVALEVDRLLKEEVLDKAVAKGEKLADRADDATFLRRASLDLIGELPTPGEITTPTRKSGRN